MRFIPNNERVRREMLAEMGLSGIDDLFASIPQRYRLQKGLNIAPGQSEAEHLALFDELAGRNLGADCLSFLGAGAYDHFSPLVVDALLQRAEFFTAYTPYQPEVSQGTLQAIFEFQTFICCLTGMDVANASVYDGASATAEAVLMADRLQKRRRRVLLPVSLHPHYRAVVETYCTHLELTLETVPADPVTGRMDLESLAARLDEDVASVVVQQPNFYGVVEDLSAIAARATQHGTLTIAAVSEALSMAVLKPPADCGVDIVCGEAQSFGVPLAYGGPYLGFMACRDVHKRQLPGRIAGQTVDTEGRRGFVLTLATREQHIRRERATSNICTNENLVMLAALFYLTLMGRDGLRQVAGHNVSLLAYLAAGIAGIEGYTPRFIGPRFNEVALRCPRSAAQVVVACRERGIVPGLDLGRFDANLADTLLVAVTESKTKADVDHLLDALRGVGP